MTEDQLSALLRLKRFEQPQPEYFDRLLQDIHRRQRAELLQRPLWRIAFERVQTFFSEHSMGNLSYAGAMAGALMAGVGTIFFLTPGAIEPQNSPVLASSAPTPAKPGSLISLQSIAGPTLPTTFEPQMPQPSRRAAARDPRYVIDARPVSYEPEPFTSF